MSEIEQYLKDLVCLVAGGICMFVIFGALLFTLLEDIRNYLRKMANE